MLSTLYANISTLGTTIAGMNAKFTTVFANLPMLGIALIGFALAAMQYNRSVKEQNMVATAPKSADNATDLDEQDGEIHGDEL